MKTVKLYAPSHWASAIVNLDYSSLDPNEVGRLNKFLVNQGLSFLDCLDCKQAGFMWNHDAAKLTGAAICHEYTFRVQ